MTSLQKEDKPKNSQKHQEENRVSIIPKAGISNLMLQNNDAVEDLRYRPSTSSQLSANFGVTISNCTLDLLFDNSVRHPTILENYFRNSKGNNEIKISETSTDTNNPKVIIELVNHTLCDNILPSYLPKAKPNTPLKLASSNLNNDHGPSLKCNTNQISFRVNANKEALSSKTESFTKSCQQSSETNNELTRNQALLAQDPESNQKKCREDNKDEDSGNMFIKLRTKQSTNATTVHDQNLPNRLNNNSRSQLNNRPSSLINNGESTSQGAISKLQCAKMHMSNLATDCVVPVCSNADMSSSDHEYCETTKHSKKVRKFSSVPQNCNELLPSEIKYITKSRRRKSRTPKFTTTTVKRVSVKYFTRRKRAKTKYVTRTLRDGDFGSSQVQSKRQSIKMFSSNVNDDCVVPLSFMDEIPPREGQSHHTKKHVQKYSAFSNRNKKNRDQLPNASISKGGKSNSEQKCQEPSYELTTRQIMLIQEPEIKENTKRVQLIEGQDMSGPTLFSSAFGDFNVTMGNNHMQEVPAMGSQSLPSLSNDALSSNSSSDDSDDESIADEERDAFRFKKRLMDVLNQDCVVPFSVRLNDRNIERNTRVHDMLNNPLRDSMENINTSTENLASPTFDSEIADDSRILNTPRTVEQNQTVPNLSDRNRMNHNSLFVSPNVGKWYIQSEIETEIEELDVEPSQNPFNNGERLLTVFPPCTPSLSGKAFKLDMSSVWRVVVTCMNEYCESEKKDDEDAESTEYI